MNKSIEIYQSGEIEIRVSVDRETIWLNANDIASIFGVQRPAIVKHIGNIYKSGELDKNLTCSILEQVAKDRKKRKTNYYIGASLKDLGKKWFAFSKMNEESFGRLVWRK